MGFIKDFIPTSVQRGVKFTTIRLQIVPGRHGQTLILKWA